MIHSLSAHDVDTWYSTPHCSDSSFLVVKVNGPLLCVTLLLKQALSGLWWLCEAPLPSSPHMHAHAHILTHTHHNNFDFRGSGEGARLSMKAMHQNALAVLLITLRCLRNNRLDWISHPFFSTLKHLTVAWSHWQQNTCDWRVRKWGRWTEREEKVKRWGDKFQGWRRNEKKWKVELENGLFEWIRAVSKGVTMDVQASFLSFVLHILSSNLWNRTTV